MNRSGSRRRGRRGRRMGRRTIHEILHQQLEIALEATRLADDVCSGRADPESSRRRMRSIEHEGDDARGTLVDRIAVELSVPLEREDLFRASRGIDDVTDALRDLLRVVDEWQAPTGAWSMDVLEPAAQALEALSHAMAEPSNDTTRDMCLQARRCARQLRRSCQERYTFTFTDPVTSTQLRELEILRRIDVIGTTLSGIADSLMDGMIKRFL